MRQRADLVGIALAIATIILGAMSFVGCEPPPDVMLMAGGADGGVVAIQQAVTGQHTVNFSEDLEVSWNGSYETLIMSYPSVRARLPYYLNSAHVGVVWDYYMSGPAWVPVPSVSESHASNSTTSFKMVGSGQRGCWEGIGCVVLPAPVVDYTDYHHFATWNSAWTPPGTDPNLPHPPVYVRRRYVIECPGGNYSRAFGYGTSVRLDTAGTSVNITVSGRTPTPGIWLAPGTWQGIADDCNYGQEIFTQTTACSKGMDPVWCFTWPS